MQPRDGKTGFRIWGRVEHAGPNEFVAVVTAIPENGDPSGVQTLAEILPSLQAAQATAKRLVSRMGEIVVSNGGRISDIETDGL